jgi:hypothetical protein
MAYLGAINMKKDIVLTGNTYAHRDEIKRIPGAGWDATKKAWVIKPGTMKERAMQSRMIYALRSKGIQSA